MHTERWNEICFLLSENIRKEISEELFEKQVIPVLRELGWKQSLHDFEIKPSYQMGSNNRIAPDFVVKAQDGRTSFVIEIKQPNLPLSKAFQKQLFSYMRQLKSKYGILIGQAIQIFYDGDEIEQDDPILLETINYEKNSKQGEKFSELFSKDSFSKEALEKYASDFIAKINKKEKIKVLINRILSDDFKKNLSNLIKQEFVSQYDGEVIDSALQDIDLHITKKTYEQSFQHQPSYSPVKNNKLGVIKSIIDLITTKPKTQEEILTELVKLFPNRLPDSMMNTIKAQLGGNNPLRIEKERNIQVKVTIGNDNIRWYSLSKSFNNSNNRILESHIFKSFKMNKNEFSKYLADKYIVDDQQKALFLSQGVWLKIILNYIGGLLLKSEGKEIFAPKDIREVLRTKVIPSLAEMSDVQLSGCLLTQDVCNQVPDPKWHNGFPCLEKVGDGKYKFIGLQSKTEI
jgi:hypothetical protein